MHIIILALLYCSLSLNTLAEDKTVTIAVTDFPPFEFLENGQMIGMNHDTISDVLSRSGYKAVFVPLPFKRGLTLTESGEIDAIASIKKSSDRIDKFIFSDPLIYTQDYFFKKKTFNSKLDNIKDLKPYRIGIVDKYFYGDNINKENLPNLAPITSTIPEVDNLEKLKADRVDLVLCPINVCNYWINKYPKLFIDINYAQSPILNDKQTLHIAFSRKNGLRSEEIVKKFNEELARYKAEGGVKKNIIKYDPNADLETMD